MMKHFVIALLCTVAIVAAQGRTLGQARDRVAPAAAPSQTTGDEVIRSSFKAANATANVTMAVDVFDLLGKCAQLLSPFHACAGCPATK
jgi:hypothetical protein